MDLDQWVHLAAIIDEEGKLSLLVNAWPVAESQGSLLARTPVGPLSVGADVAPLIGEYGSPLHWQGLLQDARVYRGAVSRERDRDLLGEWANRPACGCRK